MTKEDILKLERETFETNKEKLIATSEGKYVLIKGNQIINTFNSEKDAIISGIEKFGNTPFYVRKIEKIEQTQNFTSNLIKCEPLCHH
jgi:hypothetical protein